MDSFTWMLALICAGFTCMTTGFSFRNLAWGPALLGIGIALTLSTIAYKMYLTFSF